MRIYLTDARGLPDKMFFEIIPQMSANKVICIIEEILYRWCKGSPEAFYTCAEIVVAWRECFTLAKACAVLRNLDFDFLRSLDSHNLTKEELYRIFTKSYKNGETTEAGGVGCWVKYRGGL